MSKDTRCYQQKKFVHTQIFIDINSFNDKIVIGKFCFDVTSKLNAIILK